MSGRKQHFIPQSLLRGFAAEFGRTRQAQVWVFGRGRPPFRTATYGIAAQRYFYSEPSVDGSETLDDVITKYEDGLGQTIAEFRTGVPRKVSSSVAEEMIAHLTLRNAHLRSSVSHAFNSVAEGAIELLSSVDNASNLLGLNSNRPGQRFREAMERNIPDLQSLVPQGLPASFTEYAAFVYAKEFFRRSFDISIAPLIEGFRRSLEQTDFRSGHNSILSKMLFPPGMFQSTPISEWRIVDVDFQLVLPDCVAIAVDGDGEPSPALFGDLKKALLVAIPVARHRLLVGTAPEASLSDLNRFNHWAAACSHEFFISPSASTLLGDLHSIIGTRSMLALTNLVARSIADANYREIGAHWSELPIRLNADLSANPPVQEGYQVKLVDFGDIELAGNVSSELSAIVSELSDLVSLRRLDGFTFAVDYPKALAEIDRGISGSAPLTTIAEEYGVGVFQAPIVFRQGVAKAHVIARAEVALNLLSESNELREASRYLAVLALSQVAFVNLVDDAAPGFWGGQYTDPSRSGQLAGSVTALKSYYGSRLAIALQSDVVGDQVELVRTSIAVFGKRVEVAIKQHWVSPDFEMLGETALDGAVNLLTRLCELMGSLHGLDRSPSSTEVINDLEGVGLGDWGLALDLDLKRWWSSLDGAEKDVNFFCLEHHVDRLCWAVSIVLWADEGGQPRVYAPLPPVDGPLDG